jgi:hypothetical protein
MTQESEGNQMKRTIESTNDESGPSRSLLMSTFNELVNGNRNSDVFRVRTSLSRRFGVNRRRLVKTETAHQGLQVSIRQTINKNLKFTARTKGSWGVATVGRLVATKTSGPAASLVLRTSSIRFIRTLPLALGTLIAIKAAMDFSQEKASYEFFAPLAVFVASVSLRVPRRREFLQLRKLESSSIAIAFEELCALADPGLQNAIQHEALGMKVEAVDKRRAILFADMVELLLSGGFIFAILRYFEEKKNQDRSI